MFEVKADIVYRNDDNMETNTIIEPPNLIQQGENNQSSSDNIVVDVLQFNDQNSPPVLGATNVPPGLQFDIDDPEGMM